jgi:hypothetical protein
MLTSTSASCALIQVWMMRQAQRIACSSGTETYSKDHWKKYFIDCRLFLIALIKDNVIPRLAVAKVPQPTSKSAPENSDPAAIDAAFEAAVDDAFGNMPARP